MLLGLDLGTSSVKALLMDEDGAALGEGSASYAVRAPRPGWAESSSGGLVGRRSGSDWCCRGRRGAEVTALGLSGQMHGVVLADELGLPLRPAVTLGRCQIRRRAGSLPGGSMGTCAAGSQTRRPWAWQARASCGCATTSPTRIHPQGGLCSRRTGSACASRARSRQNRRMPRPPCSTISPPTTGPTRRSRT